ncbi:MAG: radical SAM protein [Bacteroidales bacterium]|nr:radical SAM protein [Bacteroidales bacterium]MDD4671781.1 radical SAM protein [Bacteroidales bacterium]MDY0347359.1 radical SAM protein [Tenuifilaceae bacterium]
MNKRKISKIIKRLRYLPTNKKLHLYIANKFKAIFLRISKSTKVAYPSTVMIELTNHCNLHCTICPREYRYGQEMDKGKMSVRQAKDIIDELWPYLDSIGLTGMGETFMYENLEEIVDYIKAKNKGIIISISTNAVLPHFIEKAKRVIGKIDTIQVSIDGTNSVYNAIRKGSSFSTLTSNLTELTKLCKGTTTSIMLNMVVTKENYTHMPRLVEYASEIGVKYVDFTLLNLAAVTDIDASYYNFYKSDSFLSVCSALEKTLKKYPKVTITSKNFKTQNSFQKCPFPWTHFYFTWDGFSVPCCAKPFPKELTFGNVINNRVLNILNSKGYREFREMWFKNQPPLFCKKCHFINIPPITSKSSS